MKSRPVAAAFFVALCLLLCGLILHRQIAAHPLPAETARRFDGEQMGMGRRFDGDPRGGLMDLQSWHAATPFAVEQAHKTVQGQLTALRAGDGSKAMSYQSRSMRHMFADPTQFEKMIASQYPEFAQCRHARYGPVWTDKTEQYARAIVIVEGENGHQARGEYLLIREGGQFKVGGVQAQRLPD